MKRRITGLLIIALVAFMNCIPQGSDFAALRNLEGTWVMQTKRGPLYESWKLHNNSELRSKSFKLDQSNDTIMLERVTLIENADGIFYIPVVEDQNNKQPVSFKLKSIYSRKYTFENLAHDYPQRIIYNLIKSDSIVARIEGTKNGKTMGSDYYFKRSAK